MSRSQEQTKGTNRSDSEDRLYRLLFWLAVLASVIVFFWGIWSLPVLSLNEGRRMTVVREMLSNHNWLIPTINEKAYVTKPPLFYWVTALFALIFRNTAEWVMRLPSSASALFVTWFTFDRIKRYIGRWPALFAATILITSHKFTVYSRLAEIEMLLALCCTVAAFLFLDYLRRPEVRGKLYLSYLFWGLAFLAKGAASLPFFVPPLLLLWLIRRDRNILKGLLSLRGWTVFAMVALPWFVYSYLQLGERPWEIFFRRDILGKTYWAKERSPLWRYLLDLVTNFSPWIFLIAYKTRDRLKGLFASLEMSYWSCWFLVPFIIIGSCAVKHAKYILPLFPAAAAILGIWAASVCSDLRSRWGPKANRFTLAVVGVLLLGWSLFYALAEPYFFNYRYACIKPIIEKVRQIQGSAPLFSYNHKYPRLIYYYQAPLRHIHEQKMDEMLKDRESFLLIAEDNDWGELEAKGLCVLAEYRPFLKQKKAARLLGSPDFCKSGGAIREDRRR